MVPFGNSLLASVFKDHLYSILNIQSTLDLVFKEADSKTKIIIIKNRDLKKQTEYCINRGVAESASVS